MAITITQDCFDEGLTVSNANNVIAATSTNVTNPKFKYIFDIYFNGNLAVRIRRSPNPSGAGIISLREVGRSFCNPTFENNDNAPIDYTPQISADDFWSSNRETVKFCKVEVGEEYAASATAAPEIQAGSYVSTDGYIMLGAQQVQDGQTFPVSDYQIQSNPNIKKFLSVVQNGIQYVTNEDWGVLGFMQFESGQSVYGIEINYYDINNNQLGGDDVNVSSTGMSSYTSIKLNGEGSAVKYFGAWPMNLITAFGDTEASPDHPANNGWAYYTITLLNANGDALTETMKFQLMDCKPYQNFRLKFQNNIGGWDYFNFNIGHRETFEVDRNEYQKLFGSWAGSTYAYDFWERGKAVSNSIAVESFQVNSDYIDESYSEFFKQLMNSREVYWLTNGKSIPVVLTDSSKRIKKALDGDVIRYDFNFETAHEIISA